MKDMSGILNSNLHAVEFLPLQRMFLVFIAFSFIGWVSEVFYVGVFHEHKFVNRGFLKGPLCPVYGCGGLAVLLFPPVIRDSYALLFLCTMIASTLIEYVAAWYLETTFHMKWWDYSHYKFNIKGRVCLLNALLFGMMGVIVVRFILPFIEYFILSLNNVMTACAANVIGVVFVFDFVTTVRRLVDFKTFMEKAQDIHEQLREKFEQEAWYGAATVAEKLEMAKAKLLEEKESHNVQLLRRIDEVIAHQKKHQELLKLFPTARSLRYKESVEMLRAQIRARLEDRKAR